MNDKDLETFHELRKQLEALGPEERAAADRKLNALHAQDSAPPAPKVEKPKKAKPAKPEKVEKVEPDKKAADQTAAQKAAE